MDTFVTVLAVQYPQQLWIIKGRLESEGIQCFVKDELTVQAYNLYSNAIGGVKLQVLEKDVEKAREILTELEYIKEEPVKVDLLTRIDKKTSFIPFLRKFNVGKRIIIISLLSVVLFTTLVYFIVRPTVSELLIRKSWCVDRIDYKGRTIGPKTTGYGMAFVTANGESDCTEKVVFSEGNNNLMLPGVNSNATVGSWRINDDKNMVIVADSLKNIFDGIYSIDISGNDLKLKSKTTLISAHQDNFSVPLPF